MEASTRVALPVLHPLRGLREDVQRALSGLSPALPGDDELESLTIRSLETLGSIADEGHKRWVVTYSGGKDSTLTAILTTSYLLANPNLGVHLDVIYSDTLMEMPPLREAATSMMTFMRSTFRKVGLDASVHLVMPEVKDRFWVKLLGRGYPPPGPHFRWCTHRMKIKPANALLERKKKVQTAVLTGVRYGESAARTSNLRASCATGGECGQDYWFTKGPQGSNRSYYAPIVQWRTCKVWDFLVYAAPKLGWPTEKLYALYGNQDLRFGCWTCTLVKRDKTMEDLMGRPGMENLVKMHEFRDHIVAQCNDPENRVRRADGRLGPVKLQARKRLLRGLIDLREKMGLQLITPEEIRQIKREWKKREWRNGRGGTQTSGRNGATTRRRASPAHKNARHVQRHSAKMRAQVQSR